MYFLCKNMKLNVLFLGNKYIFYFNSQLKLVLSSYIEKLKINQLNY